MEWEEYTAAANAAGIGRHEPDDDGDDGDDDGDNDEDSEGSDGSLTMPMLMPREGSQTRLWEQRSSSSAFVPSLIARICR